uniref:Kinetochore associated 1 n=1 Tax=Chelonoidis abingdonii TaxID=106734 RepID=A0A8C0H4L5_CHEAB
MWNDIELLTNDDTGSGRLNIDSRQECGTALYQEDTLVKITSSEKVLCNPKLYACNSSDGCIIVADRSVALLDTICQSFQMHIQFDTEVDVVGLCQKGHFLVVGERSGNLHLIHVPSKQTLLTNVRNLLFCFILSLNETNLTTTRISNIQPNFGFVFFCFFKQGKGDCVLSKWEVDPSKNLVSVQSFNVLSMWDVYSLTLIWDWPLVHIEEFLLTTESDTSSVIRQGISSLKLITLTVPVNKQMRNLMVFSLPAMHLLYSLEVSDVSSLVQSGISTVCLYFFKKSPEGPVSVLVLRSLTEALPENRLSRLLHKHKFTEAENFAIQFGLDVELVYKVKASAILEKLASSSIGSYGQTVWLDLVDEAKENLHKTQDNHFVVDYCINAPWPTFETTQEMLNYAKIRILKRNDKMIASLSDGVQVLITFPHHTPSGIAWTEFLNNEDIFKNILFQLQEGNLPCAQYLWLRHQADFESSFDVKMLEDLLNTICAPIPVKELCLWFKNVVIPFVRRVVPKGQKILAKWLEQGARNLELTDKANWPENGLQMAEVFFTSKNPGELGLASSWRWIPLKCGDCEEVHQLKKLVNDLQELVDLYRKYSCKLALCDFEKENASTIVFRMFDKVLAPELIPSILEKFIKPYIHEHNLQQDELLLQYIKDLLERCRTRSTSVFETAWEAKAIAVIGCISDTDKTQIFGDIQEDEELRRVIYLLQPRPMDYSSRMLFAITTSATSPIGVNQLTFAQRSRALKCLIYLADADTVESLFKKPIEKVKYFLQCFIYLAELERLNIPYTYESFHRSPKEGMIKGLWKNHSHEPTAARLVTELSLEYKVYDPQLWSGLLQKLLGFNMNMAVLYFSLSISPFFFSSASCPPSPKQLEACCECFMVLLKCPVLADLDTIGIARQYAQLDLTAFALGCLLLIPQTEKREQHIQGFLSSCNPEAVLQQVDEHMNTGEVAGFASQIRCLILDNIINEKQYEQFFKTKYFPLLKLQVMNTHRVKELVDYLANKSCMDDAAALIVEYQKQCGNPILADKSSCDILKVKGSSYPTYLGLKRKY